MNGMNEELAWEAEQMEIIEFLNEIIGICGAKTAIQINKLILFRNEKIF